MFCTCFIGLQGNKGTASGSWQYCAENARNHKPAKCARCRIDISKLKGLLLAVSGPLVFRKGNQRTSKIRATSLKAHLIAKSQLVKLWDELKVFDLLPSKVGD